jgi:hypothetical protein
VSRKTRIYEEEPLVLELEADASRFQAAMRRAADLMELFAWRAEAWTLRVLDEQRLTIPVQDAWYQTPPLLSRHGPGPLPDLPNEASDQEG